MRDLAEADELPVEPDIKARIHALEIQKQIARGELFIERKFSDIEPAGILVRDKRRVGREGIFEIAVERNIVAAVNIGLPAARNGDFIKTALTDIFGGLSQDILKAFEKAEIPLAAERKKIIGLPALACSSGFLIRKGNKIGARLKAVDMKSFKRFVISRCSHRRPPEKRFFTTIILMLSALKVNKNRAV